MREFNKTDAKRVLTNVLMAVGVLGIVLIRTEMVFAQSNKAKSAETAKSSQQQKKKPSTKQSAPIKATPDLQSETSITEDGTVVGSSTKIDFSETSIDGKMKAPDGFFLQGRNSNSLSQMVKLRSNFQHELRNSQSAVKSQIK